MTTILYDHRAGKIAIDGRTTGGNVIVSEDCQKWVRDGDDYYFLCGLVCDEQRLIDRIKDQNADAPKWKIDASAFLVSGGKVYQCLVSDDGEPMKSLVSYSDFMGSGGAFAIAAHDHGKTAREAIEYAMTRDTGTGGKVTVFDVNRMEFDND